MSHSSLNSNDFAPIPAKHDPYCSTNKQIHNDGEENLEEQDFSFACVDLQRTFVFADEIFDNGQIRPMFPTLDQSLHFTSANSKAASPLRPPLKKLFVEQHNIFCSKPYNESSPNMIMVEVEASNEWGKKSNSTWFSKLWRFRQDLKLQSNSNSKDAFVFLNPPMPGKSNKTKVKNVFEKKEKGKNSKMTLSAHEKLYVMNRKRK